MEIMDPLAYELLARPPPPDFGPLPCGGAVNAATMIEQLDGYLRAIGVLSSRPAPAHVAPPTPPGYTTPAATRRGVMELPPMRDLCAAAVGDPQLQPLKPDLPIPARLKNSAMAYDAEIDANLRAMEKVAGERPSPDYLDKTQGGRIDQAARASLVRWMIDFSDEHCLDGATLHRAVSYADRFLSARPLAGADIDRQLRLLGGAAVYAAAKFEDREAARDLGATEIASCCGAGTGHQEVLATERALVAALRYRLGRPTADTFLEHFARHRIAGGEEDDVQRLAHHLADISLLDYRCVKLLPSAVAAAAIFLAWLAVKPSYEHEQVQRLSRELEELTGYKPANVRDGVECMYELTHAPGLKISPLFFPDPSS